MYKYTKERRIYEHILYIITYIYIYKYLLHCYVYIYTYIYTHARKIFYQKMFPAKNCAFTNPQPITYTHTALKYEYIYDISRCAFTWSET